MAEGNLSVVAGRIRKFLDSEEMKIGSLSGVRQKLLQSIQKLDPLLLDAEKKSQHDSSVRDWLMKLEDVLYDADNLLDDFSNEALGRTLTTKNKMAKLQVCNDFFSSMLKNNMSRKINEVTRDLGCIATQREDFDLVRSEKEVVVMKTEENSGNQASLSIDEVVLRKGDKMEMIKILLHMEYKENVEVLPVVGKVGLGKTRLAEDVCKDEKIRNHFGKPVWIAVHESFDVAQILREIHLKVTGREVDDLQNNRTLRKEFGSSLSKKPYLIVLDDVRNKYPAKWNSLKNILKAGAKGSKILVTTRYEEVANLVEGNIRSYPLRDLNEKQSRILFERNTFRQVQERNSTKDRSYQRLVGKEIINRCAGHPLVITAVARMLRSESIKQWRSFYKNEISKIGDTYDQGFSSGSKYSSDHNQILELLKLCYDHLPSPLKHCFAYCSLFPEDHEIDVPTLIKLWMAQGFIIEKAEKSLEEVGYEYFLILLERYFFQEVERDATNQVITKCKLHNLMHDLAMSVAGDKCKLLSSSDDCMNKERSFHLWFNFDLSSTEDIDKFNPKRIRSIFFSGQSRRRYRGMPVNKIFDKITYRYTFLRALDMHASGIEIVPKSIGKLNLLKYLDLSENEDITELPNSITKLLNLHTLKLSSCFKLKKLPRDFSNLVNLRHLEIDGCNNLTSLPRGIRQLHKLKALSQLVVSEDSSIPDVVVKELQELRELTEKFQIRNLRLNLSHEKHVAKYFEAVPSQIRSLSLEWEGHASESVSDETPLIRNLSSDLEELSINGFRGVTFFWPQSELASKLVKLTLSRCANCTTLLLVHQLPCLKELVLDHLTNLKFILVGDAFLSTLEKLWLTELPNLQGWWINTVRTLTSFPHLSKLVIEDCPNLVYMPLFPDLEDLVLDRTSWKLFEITMNQNTAAQEAPSLSISPPPLAFSNLNNLTAVQEAPSSSASQPPPPLSNLNNLTVAEEAPSPSTSGPLPPPLSKLKNLCIVGIKDCKAVNIKWENLRNLQFLKFDCLPKLETLPDGLKEVTSLQELHVWRCGIEKIPDWISKLQKLEKLVIRICPLLKELPEDICHLPVLRTLEIEDCDDLLRRCEENIGADWSKIAKIQKMKLGLKFRR